MFLSVQPSSGVCSGCGITPSGRCGICGDCGKTLSPPMGPASALPGTGCIAARRGVTPPGSGNRPTHGAHTRTHLVKTTEHYAGVFGGPGWRGCCAGSMLLGLPSGSARGLCPGAVSLTAAPLTAGQRAWGSGANETLARQRGGVNTGPAGGASAWRRHHHVC